MIPYEYYTGHQLQPGKVEPCQAGQPKGVICMMYKYLDVKQFPVFHAETGTNSRGLRSTSVQSTKLFSDPDILSQLSAKGMAELSKNQVGL